MENELKSFRVTFRVSVVVTTKSEQNAVEAASEMLADAIRSEDDEFFRAMLANHDVTLLVTSDLVHQQEK